MLSQDFREFIESLNTRSVRYLVVGGYAVAVHGHPRYTKDLDVWIDPTPDNISRLLGALADFGFGSLGLKAQDFSDPEQMVQLGRPPNRVDLMTAIPGVTFGECYAARLVVGLGGVDVSFVGLEALRRNKQATGRTQDLADLENLGTGE